MEKFLDYVKNFALNFIKTRTVAYYVAAGATLVAWLAGVIASGALGFAGATALPALLVTLGLILFVALSIVGHEKIGTALVAATTFGAFVATFCEVYAYFLEEIQKQAMTGFNIGAIAGVSTLIVCIVMFVIGAVAANVLAFLKLSKTAEPAQGEGTEKPEEEIKEEVATDGVN